jgi:PAS domain S-box-containing protein
MDIARYWETIFKTLHDGLLIVDARGTILAVNPAAERLTGYSAAEIVGQNCRILNCTGCQIYGRGLAEDWCGLFQRGRIRSKRCVITNKEGRSLDVMKNASILKDEDGKMIGAVETLTDISEIVRRDREIMSLRHSCQLDEGFHGLVGHSAPMQALYELVENVARSEAPVLIHGPSGAGKELVARAIHESGPRQGKPFIKVNCAALNENLLESELFGHVKGAYTGADRFRVGRFEAAHEGTIFLDEIGDIPAATQVKLLRVLEEKEIERVGDHRPVAVDVRVVSATNRDLEGLVAEGRFREDLYFRINVFPLRVPSLSERREDIPPLVNDFIRHNNRRTGKPIGGLTPEAMTALLDYDWPGNVRELRNAIEYAFVLCPGGWIEAAHLPPRITQGAPAPAGAARRSGARGDGRARVLQALREAEGNQSEAARLLGVSRVTVWKRIRKYGIDLARDL